MNIIGLSSDQWSAVSAIGTVVSATASTVGLVFVGFQIRAARKGSDIQSLNEFMRSITEREQILSAAPDESGQDRAFYELANYLELQAAALYGGLFNGVTKKIVAEKLNDSLAVIELSEQWDRKLRAAESTPTTFEHLRRFVHENRFGINRAKNVMQNAAAQY